MPVQVIRLPQEVERWDAVRHRSRGLIDSLRPEVRSVIDDIRENGDEAVIRYHRRFDGVSMRDTNLRVSPEELDEAVSRISYDVRAALYRRHAHASALHKQQAISPAEITVDGIRAGELVRAVRSAGLYVPGGSAPFPTVMQILAVPAKIAGVPRVVACISPRLSSDVVLAAARLSGVDEVYRISGVAAVAALALGTQSISSVALVAGPGNAYVTAAKLEVSGTVAIDTLAGPSEAIILCEESTNPEWAALDVLARAEHGDLSAAVVLTWSERLATTIASHVNRLAPTFSRQHAIHRALGKYCAIVIAPSRRSAVDIINEYAPEHLEILAEKPEEYLPDIHAAGSVFLGHHTPVAVGDYLGFTNHVLPSTGYARCYSPVSVRTFQKILYYTEVSPDALRRELAAVMQPLAESEGFDAHLASLAARVKSVAC